MIVYAMDQIWPGAVDVLWGWSSLEPRLEVGIPSDLKIVVAGSNPPWFEQFCWLVLIYMQIVHTRSQTEYWPCKQKLFQETLGLPGKKSFSRSQQFLGLRSTVFHLKATEGGLYRMTTTTGQFATGWRWSMMRNLSLSWRMMSSASRDG